MAILLEDNEIEEVIAESHGDILLAIQNAAKRQHKKSTEIERQRISDFLEAKYGGVGRNASRTALYRIAKELDLDLIFKLKYQ